MPVSRILQIWRNLAAHPLNGSVLQSGIRWSIWQFRSRLAKEVTISWVNGLKLTGRNGMISISMQAYNGLHELRDTCFACHLLNESDLFYDVGANIGVYSLVLGGVAGARGLAFEPVPMSANYLVKNLTQNGLGDRVKVMRMAVSSRSGTVSMSTEADVMNKIVSDGAGLSVPSVTLDDVALEHGTPQLIKIDVEGFEPEVIAGSGRVLADSKLLAVILEVNDNAREDGTASILHTLTAHGFIETDYDPKSRRLIPVHSSDALDNRLFIRAVATPQIADRLRAGRVINVRSKEF